MKHEQILKCLRIPQLLISKETIIRTYLRKKERPQPKGGSFCRVGESLLGFKGESAIGTVARCRLVQLHRLCASQTDTQPGSTFTTPVTVPRWSCWVKSNKFHNPSDEFERKASGSPRQGRVRTGAASEGVCESRLVSASAPVLRRWEETN